MKELMFTDKELTPPGAVAKAAREGLALRERFRRGGTDVGKRRAEQLAARRPISVEDLKSIYSYFARHAVDRREGWDDPEKPTAGFIAWQLWGGDAGRDWIGKLREQLGG